MLIWGMRGERGWEEYTFVSVIFVSCVARGGVHATLLLALLLALLLLAIVGVVSAQHLFAFVQEIHCEVCCLICRRMLLDCVCVWFD